MLDVNLMVVVFMKIKYLDLFFMMMFVFMILTFYCFSSWFGYSFWLWILFSFVNFEVLVLFFTVLFICFFIYLLAFESYVSFFRELFLVIVWVLSILISSSLSWWWFLSWNILLGRNHILARTLSTCYPFYKVWFWNVLCSFDILDWKFSFVDLIFDLCCDITFGAVF